jgi:polysaccharide export outer membrane protein
VLGQVNKAGRYPLEQANTRLSDVLAQAGGVITSIGGDIVTVVGKRNDKPYRLEVDLPRLFAADSAATDIVLQNNDVIWVDRAPQFYIYGEVQRAGAFRLERGMSLMQGLAAGGGLTQRGTEKGIRVHRKGAGKTEILQPGMDDTLRDGDVIYVRESLF